MARSIDLAKLGQFVEVAKRGSFGKAAVALSLTQPSLTRNIRSLEADVGARLFDRGPLGAVLTPAGARFLARAEGLLNDAEQAIAELANFGEGTHMQLRLGISPNFAFDLLPAALGRFLGRQPNVNVQTTIGTREALAEGLVRNTLDLALCLLPDFFHNPGVEADALLFEPLTQEHVRPYAAPDHPAAGATTLKQVAGCRWAVPHQLSVSYRYESAFYRHHLPVPVQSLNSASLSLIRQGATLFGLIALLPERLAADDVAAGRLVLVDVPELRLKSYLGIMTRKKAPAKSASALLMADLRAIAAP